VLVGQADSSMSGGGQDALITGEFKDKVMHMTITAAAA